MKLNTIDIGEKRYPILCDLNVLETLQDEFGSISEFERKLIGLEYVMEDGKYKYTSEGKPEMKLVDPSLKAIRIALVEMVNEGIAYEAYQKGTTWEMVEEIDILAHCTMPYGDLSSLLHEEYKRCFETKKSMPRESKRKKSQSSTSLG